MHHSLPGIRTQRGISLFGLVFWGVVVALVALVAMKTFPAVNEYLTVQRTVEQIAQGGSTTVPEIRAEFERRKSVEYSIQTIGGKDLEITKENDRVVISYKYDSEVPLFGPVSLLFHFAGRSK